jgi:hypothetical protein
MEGMVPPDQSIGSKGNTEVLLNGNAEVLLILVLLALLALLFYLVFRWAQRNEQASYLGSVFREAVFDFELSRRRRRIEDGHDRHDYWREAEKKINDNHPIPEYPQPPKELLQYLKPVRYDGGYHSGGGLSGLPGLGDPWGTRRPGDSLEEWDEQYEHIEPERLPEELQPSYREYLSAITEHRKVVRQWKQRVLQKADELYQMELAAAKEEAKKAASRAADVDIAVFRGRGPAFVLEFTAVVVIIFAAVILAILGKVEGQQVGTLLAAVAGYVLARATTSRTDSTKADKEKDDSD